MTAKSHLVHHVAMANRCRAAATKQLGFTLVLGRPADLVAVEVLTTSLLVQADAVMLRHGRRANWNGQSRTRAFRHAFLLSFATRVGQRLQEAEGYRAQVVNSAEGEGARFAAVQQEYVKAPEVTRRRLYLETMESVLGDVQMFLVDTPSANGQGIVPYLPLNELRRPAAQPQQPAESK